MACSHPQPTQTNPTQPLARELCLSSILNIVYTLVVGKFLTNDDFLDQTKLRRNNRDTPSLAQRDKMDFMTHEQERHDCRFFKNMMMIIVSKHCIEETVWCMLCLLNSVVHPTIVCLTSVQKCARHLEERADTFHDDLSRTNARDDLGRDG